MPNYSFGVDNDNHWGCAPVPTAIFALRSIDQVEPANDPRISVRDKWIADIGPVGKPCERWRTIIAHACQVVAECSDVIEFPVPDDRLGLAVGSPVEGVGEKQN